MPVTAPFSRAQRTTLINLVRRAAQAEIMPRFRKLERSDITAKTEATDVVTEADTAAEAMITRGLQIAFPSAVIVGEEAAETNTDYRAKLADAELGFLIDPVDGTWNFANGVPMFGTMIAACRFGRPVFGLIYDPVGREVVWADIETQTTQVPMSGVARKLSTRTDTGISDMLGYVESNDMPAPHQSAAVTACLDLRHTSSLRYSAYHYRLLAQGAVDFILASKLKPWDHAPGVMLCQQAGGHVAMLDGTPYTTSIDTGFLLSAGDEASWNMLADQFHALLD
jgi:fructose-1,6-bisphosphatase/inositol monophosphatase family enzyme